MSSALGKIRVAKISRRPVLYPAFMPILNRQPHSPGNKLLPPLPHPRSRRRLLVVHQKCERRQLDVFWGGRFAPREDVRNRVKHRGQVAVVHLMMRDRQALELGEKASPVVEAEENARDGFGFRHSQLKVLECGQGFQELDGELGEEVGDEVEAQAAQLAPGLRHKKLGAGEIACVQGSADEVYFLEGGHYDAWEDSGGARASEGERVHTEESWYRGQHNRRAGILDFKNACHELRGATEAVETVLGGGGSELEARQL